MSDEEALRSTGLDLEALARQGAKRFIEMIFRDRFYHADPHPGNLMVLVDQRGDSPPLSADGGQSAAETETDRPTAMIGVLDCGMIGRLDETLRGDIERTLLGVARGESETVVEIILRSSETPNDLDPDELRSSMGSQPRGGSTVSILSDGRCVRPASSNRRWIWK
jgi:ubiquinone biosynthesis protein